MAKTNGKRPKKKQGASVFSENLKRLSSSRGLSIRVLAQMANCRPSVIQGWLDGAAPTDFERVALLAKALGVSFSYLLLGVAESQSVDDLPIEELLVEDKEQTFSGYFKVQATRLIRPIRKKIIE